jgi:hypothetical protein
MAIDALVTALRAVQPVSSFFRPFTDEIRPLAAARRPRTGAGPTPCILY